MHKHCLQFLLGVKMASRETENNAYAKFWSDQQRVSWCVMVFSGVVNLHVSLKCQKTARADLHPLPLVTSSVLMVIDNFDIYFAEGKEIFRTTYPNKNNWTGWRKTQRKNNKTQGIKKTSKLTKKSPTKILFNYVPVHLLRLKYVLRGTFSHTVTKPCERPGAVSKPRTSSLAYLFLFGQIVTRKRLGKSRFRKHFSGKFPWANGLNLFFYYSYMYYLSLA